MLGLNDLGTSCADFVRVFKRTVSGSFLVMGLCWPMSADAQATVTDRILVADGLLETISFSGVLNDYVDNPSSSFLQTYDQPPVVVCTGQMSDVYQAPIVRVNNITTTGFSIRTQRLYSSNSSAVSGVAHCVVVERGVHQLPDGSYYQAGSVDTISTVMKSGAWYTSRGVQVPLDSNLTGDVGVVAQTLIDDSRYYERGQTVVVSRHSDARFPPFDDGKRQFLLARHTGKGTYAVGPAEVGYIAFQLGVSTFVRPSDGVPIFKAGGITDQIVKGIANEPPYSDVIDETDTDVQVQLQAAVATQQGQRGNNGAFAVIFSDDPFGGNMIDVALDEYGHSGTNRDHEASEYVAWWGFGEYPSRLVVEKSVDITSTSALDLLTYEVAVESEGGLTILPDVPQDFLAQSGSPLNLTTDLVLDQSTDTGTKGELAPGERWVFRGTYQLTQDDFADGGDIENYATITGTVKDVIGGQSVSVGSNLRSETDTRPVAITELLGQAKITVSKIAYDENDVALPEGAQVAVGDVIKYVYTITNAGSYPLEDITITDDHRAAGSLTFQACTLVTNNNNSSVGTNVGHIDDLGPLDVARCSSTYTVAQEDIDRQ